jgi:hypothetical protein
LIETLNQEGLEENDAQNDQDRREIETPEMERKPSPDRVEHGFRDVVENSYNGIIGVGIDP